MIDYYIVSSRRSFFPWLLVFLLLPLAAASQQEQGRLDLSELSPAAEQALREAEAWQDSLQTLAFSLPDSVGVRALLDSLSRQGVEAPELARKADSLLQAYVQLPGAPAELREAESKIREQLERSREALTAELLPEQVQEALQQLEQAGSVRLAERLPQAAGPDLLTGQAEGLKAQALEAAGKPLTGTLDRLGQAQADFDRYKGRLEKVESMKDLSKGFFGPNPLKGRPWQERLVLGSLWQAGRQERFFLDLGPYVAWRLTGRLSVGAGGQYRLSGSLREKPYLGGEGKVAGGFLFSDFEVKSGFFARLHYEGLNAPLPQAEAKAREWVRGLSAGVGKSYIFYRAVSGYALVQYNLLHEHGRTPYLHPLQVKVGFFLDRRNYTGKTPPPEQQSRKMTANEL